MLIACVAWGSLVWDSRDLPLQGNWMTDGPLLPVEFARQSDNEQITLVLLPEYPLVRCLWIPLGVPDLEKAREVLGKCERIPPKMIDQNISHWLGGRGDSTVSEQIGSWARALQIDAVVWTDLPPKFNGERERIPTREEVVSYLRALPDAMRKRAEHYIRMTPRQIDTEYRRHIITVLGWTPTGNM